MKKDSFKSFIPPPLLFNLFTILSVCLFCNYPTTLAQQKFLDPDSYCRSKILIFCDNNNFKSITMKILYNIVFFNNLQLILNQTVGQQCNTLKNDSTFTLLDSKFLYKAGTSASPVSLWDQTNQELHITEFNYGIYRNYKLDSLVSFADERLEVISNKIEFEVYPNPFNSQITFSFTLTTKTNVSLKIYDILGKEISEITNQEFLADSYKVGFEAKGLASGIYFAVLRTGNFFIVKKIIYLR